MLQGFEWQGDSDLLLQLTALSHLNRAIGPIIVVLVFFFDGAYIMLEYLLLQ
jgi:hypothetical protein